MWRYLRLARPHFLLGGAVLFALGARSAGTVDGRTYAIGQVMVTAIQLTAQLANEYGDAKTDASIVHRTWFSGGSGMIPAGEVSVRAALVGAAASSTIALAAILAMARSSVPAAAVGTVALGFAWGYSVEPLRLLATGAGEVLTSVVVAALVPLVGASSQQGDVGSGLWWAITVLVPLHLAMVLCFELPDLDADRSSGKRVLAVRIGRTRTHLVIAGSAAISAGVLLAAGSALGGVTTRLAAIGVIAVGALTVATSIRSWRWSVVTAAAVGSFVVIAGLLTLAA